jgi:pentose-5-phosphate-3-epimerase
MSLVVPAVLPSSRADPEQRLSFFAEVSQVERVQIDIVDHKFSSTPSWPFSAEATKGTPSELEEMVQTGVMLPATERIEYEIDLMCFDPLRFAGAWLALGASRLTFHTESSADLPQLLAEARKRYGMVSLGLALNIDSSPAPVRACQSELEYVQFMGIAKIGRQGEPFDERVFKKIETFHKMYPAMPIQVDGGVSLANARKLLALGVSNLVVGSVLAKARTPLAATTAIAAFEVLETPFGV